MTHERTTQDVKDFLASQPDNELYWILGRFCGPQNTFLCMKQFGYIVPTKLVQEEIANREFEKQVLGVM